MLRNAGTVREYSWLTVAVPCAAVEKLARGARAGARGASAPATRLELTAK